METTQQVANTKRIENMKDVPTLILHIAERANKMGKPFNLTSLLGYVYLKAAGDNAGNRVVRELKADTIDTSIVTESELDTLVSQGSKVVDYVLSKTNLPMIPREWIHLVLDNILHITKDDTIYFPFADAILSEVHPEIEYTCEYTWDPVGALGKVRSFFKHPNMTYMHRDSWYRKEKYNHIFTMLYFNPEGHSTPDVIKSLFLRLNDGGEMAVIIPAGYLKPFDDDDENETTYRFLLDEHAISNVILLPPSGIRAFARVQYAIVHITKPYKTAVYFNDGVNNCTVNNLYVTLKDYSNFVVDNRKFGSIYRLDLEAIKDAENTSRVHSVTDEFEPADSFKISIPVNDLMNADRINLYPKYHLMRTKILQNKEKGVELVPLCEITEIYKNVNVNREGRRPIIRVQNLADSILQGKKDFSELKLSERPRVLPVLLEDNLLLVTLEGQSLRPTIFEYHEGSEIAYFEKIVPLKVSPRVNVEYLQSELASDFVQEQVEAYHTNPNRPCISRWFLKNILIRIPNLKEQEKILRERKEALSAELIKKLGIENEELRNARYNEFVREMRVRKHAIGQVLNELSPAIDMLFICKEKNNGVLRGSDIVSKRSGYTVDEYLQKIRSLVNKIEYMVDSLTNEYKPKGEIKEYNVVQLIEEYFQNHSITDGFEVSIEHETFNTDIHVPDGMVLPGGDVLEPYNISAGDNMDLWAIDVCKEDFFQVLDNIIANAKRYGFTENRPDYCIRFEMEDIRDEKNPLVAIHIKNNGNPLPAGIKPEQVFMYGEGSSQGTGIGGWQIKQIVEGMGGRVELRTYEQDAAGFIVDYVLTFPDKSVVMLDDNNE